LLEIKITVSGSRCYRLAYNDTNRRGAVIETCAV